MEFQGQVPKLMDDIASYKPTIMPGVPRIFDRLYSAVTDGVKEANFVKRFLFNYGYSRKSQAIKDGFSSKTVTTIPHLDHKFNDFILKGESVFRHADFQQAKIENRRQREIAFLRRGSSRSTY